MNNKRSHDLVKLAFAAFVLSAALPSSGFADDDAEFDEMEQVDQTKQAEQACGARVRPASPTRGSTNPVQIQPEHMKAQGRGPTGARS